jgi:hypothetical protein
LIQTDDKRFTKPVWHRKTFGDGTWRLHDLHTMSIQYTSDLGVAVQGSEQLNFRGATRRRSAAHSHRQALVMSRTQHDPAGHAEQLSGLSSVFGGPAGQLPNTAARRDDDPGLVQQLGDPPSVRPGDNRDLASGQRLADIQVGSPFGQRRLRQVIRAPCVRGTADALMGAAPRPALLAHGPTSAMPSGRDRWRELRARRRAPPPYAQANASRGYFALGTESHAVMPSPDVMTV